MLVIPPNRSNSISIKLLVLAGLIFVSWIASLFVLGVVAEREDRQMEAVVETSAQWSRAQVVAGPVLSVPVERTDVTTEGELVVRTDTLHVLPATVAFSGDVASQSLTRGVYSVPVYTAAIVSSGAFDLTPVLVAQEENVRILWDKAVVSLYLADTRGVTTAFDLVWGTESYEFQPSAKFAPLGESGVHASVVIDPAQSLYDFSFAMSLKGSTALEFLPLGESTVVTFASDWSTPSFQGEFLPVEREVTEAGSRAEWQVASYGKNLPQYWYHRSTVIEADTLLSKRFGVAFHQAVDSYTMVDRATKYAILFIVLTFLTFFMYEVLSGLRIHPVQYLLVGMAIALFYLLLLSFSEVIGFLTAYLVSAVATTLLVAGYCASVLKAKGRAGAIGVLLIALYTYLYILLQLENLSLLFGAVLLFGVLATVMYLTRKLDWYTVGSRGLET
ncbi:cell envelope integrity protein CreD [Candidatus Kaiserbacteria bacterium]|nr:cell envelope integrity protein CreD [Candidatus Kaiserbacteria bacterium]MCB9812159.1 cell envelope integrity protein CreD [Candidatus Nomurabacteria bacterium]